MVAPSGLAETVTPPIFSPAADVMAPLRMASAAKAGAKGGTRAVMRAAAMQADRVNRVVSSFEFLLIGAWAAAGARRRGGGRRRRRHGLEIGHDRVDLGRLEMNLEAGHARRAVGYHLAHHARVAALRVAGDHIPALHARQLQL